MTLGPVLEVTVGVPHLAAAVEGYQRLLDLRPVAEGRSPGLIASAPARRALLGRPGAAHGRIRLVETGDGQPPRPFRTLGWAALEVLVADADAAHAACRRSDVFRVLHPPAPVGAAGRLRALQAVGPGGEGVYLTEVLEAPPGFTLPRRPAAEGLVYGVVAASADLPGTRRCFTDLGLRQVTDHSLPVRVVNSAFGLPEGTRHRVSSLQLEGEGLVEIDQYPAAAEPRRTPLGLRLVTFVSSSPAPPLVAPGGIAFEMVAAEGREGT